MRIHPLHPWEVTREQATALQRQLAGQVDIHRPLTDIHLVAGADISYSRFSDTLYAAVLVFGLEDMSLVEARGVVSQAHFPYRPGYLSFREAPAILEAFALLQTEPDAIMFDGQGMAHPRRLGLACHVGLWLQRPSLGCAKSRLTGHFGTLDREAGATAPLEDREEIVGRVVRTKTGIQPVYVSPGHLIDLESAVALVLASCRGYRLPEPTRQAHLYVNALRRGEIEPS
jgi:deoxyribonuclease V